ncbi:unnamed protein product [Coregonus sp. 'balchen']|nr:unnamed protein product [Coregonus sp. 'balchen']
MDMLKITSISTILGALGVMGSIFGTKCCNCIKSNRTRVKARFIVGIFFILAEYRWEVLFFSTEFCRWSASMLLIGGTILCCSTLKRKNPDSTTTKSTSH